MKKYLIILLIFAYFACGYDNQKAHREINKAIVGKFLSNSSKIKEFKNYSFGMNLVKFKGPAITKSGNFNATEEERDFTIVNWIIEGGYSADEPEIPAAFRHFFDPLANNGGKKHLTDINKTISVFNPEINAIDWHFIGNDPTKINDWTWINGKEFLKSALQSSDEEVKNNNIAKAFRCLGEVLHNTADMGCPPHVRNDAHGGYPGVGGADSYEAKFNPDWASKYSSYECDPNLISDFANFETAIDINMRLSEFTNKYFFSEETISGNGVETFTSRNGMKDYPNPKLEKLIYEEDNFNYYYNFPSNRKVQLCNDQSLFLGYISQNFRSYPRVTLKNVESQASELLPAIFEAGINVIKNFIPLFEINFELDFKENELRGTVKHIASKEYASTINYKGKVKFFINNQLANFQSDAVGGSFKLDDIKSKFKSGDKIIAYIDIGDILVKSNEVVNQVLQAPEISSLKNISSKYPNNYIGFSGDTIVISGRYFGNVQGKGKVLFDNELANIISWSNTEIRTIIPLVSNYYIEVKVFNNDAESTGDKFHYSINNWWYSKKEKFSAVNSTIYASANFSDGSINSHFNLLHSINLRNITFNFNGNKFSASSISYPNEQYVVTESFDGEIIEYGRKITTTVDKKIILSYKTGGDRTKKITTNINASITNIPYYGIWGTDTYDNYPNYTIYSMEIKDISDYFKLNNYEIITEVIDDKTGETISTETVTLTKINTIHLIEFQIGVIKE